MYRHRLGPSEPRYRVAVEVNDGIDPVVNQRIPIAYRGRDKKTSGIVNLK
jgi:hypothetical protein